MKKHKEETLPLWAQKIIRDLRAELFVEQTAHKQTQLMHCLTADGRSWFTLRTPQQTDTWYLWTAVGSDIVRLASLGPNDSVFISRSPYDQQKT